LGPYRFKDRFRSGKLARLEFGIYRFSIDPDLKSPARRRDQMQRANILFEPEQFFRQTDGLRLVVSKAAIFNGNVQVHH
jgi:hypothetical protein